MFILNVKLFGKWPENSGMREMTAPQCQFLTDKIYWAKTHTLFVQFSHLLPMVHEIVLKEVGMGFVLIPRQCRNYTLWLWEVGDNRETAVWREEATSAPMASKMSQRCHSGNNSWITTLYDIQTFYAFHFQLHFFTFISTCSICLRYKYAL